MERCPNCSAQLHGKFCHECGQKVIEPKDRTLKHFIYQFFGSAFFLENNVIKNLWMLLTRPGKLPLDFIEGRRKRWMPPFSLFLLINLFYFWYSPLTDLNLRLHEQLRQDHHRRLANYLVNQRLEARNITLEEYAGKYNQKSSSYANSLIVLQIPILAMFLSLFYYGKKYFFADHIIYVMYFFAFVLLAALLQSGLLFLYISLNGRSQLIWQISGFALMLILLTYIFFSLRTTYVQKTWHAAVAVVPVLVAFIVTHFIYRTLLFLIIFAVT